MAIMRFDSPSALADCADSCAGVRPVKTSWAGGETQEQASRFARVGDDSLVNDARKLLDKLGDLIDVRRPVFAPDVTGAYPIVPEAIAGFPFAMRRRIEEENESAPVCIYAGITTSSDVTGAEIRKRGIAIMALVMALSQTRPVSLFTLNTSAAENGDRKESVIICRLPTAPMDLATVCYCLTSAGYFRHLNLDIACRHHGFITNWPAGYDYNNPDKYLDGLRTRIGASDSDLFIRPVYSGDLAVSDPLAWIKGHLERYNSLD